MDRANTIFGNSISKRIYRKAVKGKNRLIRKYGEELSEYHFRGEKNPVLGDLIGIQNLTFSEQKEICFPKNAVVIGNIRMGFGHYRIGMAIASCAYAKGYIPYWFDLNSFETSICGKMIGEQNRLYSIGSRLSQKSNIFNRIWEFFSTEGFRQLSYNVRDQKNAELFEPLYKDFPKDIPFIATHVWTSQGAVYAGLQNVINAVPDNWQMAFHLSEGAIHTVQTPSAFWGYKTLRGMKKLEILFPMPTKSLHYTGHYVDHEIVYHLEEDCQRRKNRRAENKPIRYLLVVGGAGAQKNFLTELIHELVPQIKKNRAVVFLNLGDHKDIWEQIKREDSLIATLAIEHFSDFQMTKKFANNILNKEIQGLHVFYHENIFGAVYSTNLLMRGADILVTKPSELAFYPIPKILIRRVGGHEAWGAIRASELGDGTYECKNVKEAKNLLHLVQDDSDLLDLMCTQILKNYIAGIYDGGYNVVKLAMEGIER